MLLKINKNSFNVKVLIESSETSEGMMNKTFDNFDGMLFIMGDGSHSFWMMNCIIPLDIIFIDKNFKKILRSGFLQIDGYGASELAKLIGCLQPAEPPSKHPKK